MLCVASTEISSADLSRPGQARPRVVRGQISQDILTSWTFHPQTSQPRNISLTTGNILNLYCQHHVKNVGVSAKSHLRNVFRFDQVINIKQDLYWDTKLEQVVDDSLHAVASLHLVCWGSSLLLAERSWTTFKYDLLDDPGGERTSTTVC